MSMHTGTLYLEKRKKSFGFLNDFSKQIKLNDFSKQIKKNVEQESFKFCLLLRSPKVFHHCSADSSYPWSRTIRRGRDWPHGRAPRAQTCRRPACLARRPSMPPRRTLAQWAGQDQRGEAQSSEKDHWPIFRLWKTVTWIIKSLSLLFFFFYHNSCHNQRNIYCMSNKYNNFIIILICIISKIF